MNLLHIKYCIVVSLFLFLVKVSNSQIWDHYSQEDNDFTILLSPNTSVRKELNNTGYVETFVTTTAEGEFKYVLIITKAGSDGNKQQSLLSDDFKQSYLENCLCSISESNEIEYYSVKSVQFKIHVNSNNKKFEGYSENVIVQSNLYNITYLTMAGSLTYYESEYFDIMNSLIIYE